MTYLLDTNACVRYLTGRSPRLRERVDSVGEERLVVCSVVKAELYFGAAKSQSQEKALAAQRAFLGRFPSIAFDDRAAEHYARIREELERAGIPIGANDLLIAAITIAHDLTLVTHNTQEFARVKGLKLEDWEG